MHSFELNRTDNVVESLYEWTMVGDRSSRPDSLLRKKGRCLGLAMSMMSGMNRHPLFQME